MSTENEALVTEFCNALGSGNMDTVVSYLSEDVFYHNMPWEPVTGHAGVRQVLDPFIGANLLQKMEIPHTGLLRQCRHQRALWRPGSKGTFRSCCPFSASSPSPTAKSAPGAIILTAERSPR